MNEKIVDKNIMFEENTGLIWGVIHKKFKTFDALHEDMYQVGAMALWQAIGRYDPTKGVEFSTYATVCISGKIKEYIIRDSGLFISYSSLNYEITKFINARKEKMKKDNIYEEAKKTFGNKINYQMFETFYAKLTVGTMSMGHDMEIEDREFNLEDYTEGEVMYKYYIDMVQNMGRVSERDKNIWMDYISSRMNGRGETLQSLGTKYNLTRERVRQIVEKIQSLITFYDIN